MRDLISHEEEPLRPVSISKTELAPVQPNYSRSGWRKFVDLVRQTVGLKPIDLAVRLAEARVRMVEAQTESVEIDNQIKLMRAKQQFDLVQLEIRRQDCLAQGEPGKAEEEGEKLSAEIRTSAGLAKIQQAAAREIERRTERQDSALKRLEEMIDKIRALGGDVEIGPQDGSFDLPDDEAGLPT